MVAEGVGDFMTRCWEPCSPAKARRVHGRTGKDQTSMPGSSSFPLFPNTEPDGCVSIS